MTALGLKVSIEEARDVAKRAIDSKDNVKENVQVGFISNLLNMSVVLTQKSICFWCPRTFKSIPIKLVMYMFL